MPKRQNDRTRRHIAKTHHVRSEYISEQAENSNTNLDSDEPAISIRPPQLSEVIWQLPREMRLN